MKPPAKSRGGSGTTTARPEISVVVPVLNAERTIGTAVEAVLAQDYPATCFEVIVVDNGSTDATVSVLARYLPRIRLVTEQTRGAAAARNAGIRGARSRYLAFTDADCVPQPTWLRELAACAMSNEWADVVGGRIVAYQPRSRIERFAEALMDQQQAICEFRPPYAITANLFMRKAALERLGLFDETLLRGQDVDLSYRGYLRHGFRFAYAEAAVVRHVNPRTLRELFRKGVQHGEAAAAILGKYAAELGQTPWQRCTDSRRYGEIVRHLARSLGHAALAMWPTDSSRSLAVENVYQAVFKAGKQLGLVRGTLNRARRHHGGGAGTLTADR